MALAPATQGAQETALAAWVVTLMAPLADANARQHETIERQADRIADLSREAGAYAERLAAQKRLREAAMARAAELEQRLAAATRPPDPTPAPDPFPSPTPPTPNVGPRRRHPRWRRWLRQAVLGE